MTKIDYSRLKDIFLFPSSTVYSLLTLCQKIATHDWIKREKKIFDGNFGNDDNRVGHWYILSTDVTLCPIADVKSDGSKVRLNVMSKRFDGHVDGGRREASINTTIQKKKNI